MRYSREAHKRLHDKNGEFGDSCSPPSLVILALDLVTLLAAPTVVAAANSSKEEVGRRGMGGGDDEERDRRTPPFVGCLVRWGSACGKTAVLRVDLENSFGQAEPRV